MARKLTKSEWRARLSALKAEAATLQAQADLIRAQAQAQLLPINDRLKVIAKQAWHCEQALAAPSTNPTLTQRLRTARQAIATL